jgi:actin-related protein
MICGDEVATMVVEIGSSNCKFGHGGQDCPRYNFRSDVAVTEEKETRRMCGDIALRQVRKDMEVEGVVTANGGLNWDNIEALLSYGIGEMKIECSENPIMLGEGVFSSMADKETLIELCFEKYGNMGAYMAPDATLSSFSAGRPTSLVLDLGAAGTRLTPVVDGFALRKANVVTDRGGNWMDKKLQKEISAAGYTVNQWFDAKPGGKAVTQSFRDAHMADTLREIKAWMCFVPVEPIAPEMRAAYVKRLNVPPYELPDGTKVCYNDAITTLPEQLFLSNVPRGIKEILPYDPALVEQAVEVQTDSDPLQELLLASVAKCDVDARRDLLGNILVVGGGSLIDGVIPRLTHELSALLPSSFKRRMPQMLPIERTKSVWIGGSILSICGSFQQMWASKEEYSEMGSSLITDRFSF